MLEGLIHLVTRLGHWGYLAIFLVVTLESAAFLGFLMPGETLVVLGGFLASQGVLNVQDLIALVAIGAILGDSIGYEMGRYLGREWLLRIGRRVGWKESYMERVDGFFHRHGGKTVFLARFSAFFRIMVPFFAGAARFRYPTFLLFNALGAILWSIGSVMLGYAAGESWRIAERWIGRAGAIAVALSLALVAGVWLMRRYRKQGT